jgi:NADH dehydrogenase
MNRILEQHGPHLVVTGGSGFLGRHVCRVAVEAGCRVTSISRGGRPADEHAPYADSVEWVAADIFAPDGWQAHLIGCDAVIHCVGTLLEDPARGVTHERLIFESARLVADAAARAAVPAFVLVSAASAPPGTASTYLDAHRRAEAHLEALPFRAVVLRPSLIYSADKPDSMKDKQQMDRLQSIPFLGRKLKAVRPLPVEAVAHAAVLGALHPAATPLLSIDAIERLATAPLPHFSAMAEAQR